MSAGVPLAGSVASGPDRSGNGTKPAPARSPGFFVVNTAMLWLTTAVASAALWPIYRSTHLVILIVVVTVTGSAIAILGALLRWSALVVTLASIVAYLLLGVPLAVPDRALFGVLPSADGLLALLSSAALGWKQLLTITLPVGSYQALLVPAFVLVLGTVVAGLSAALRARRGELAVFAPTVLFLAAIAFGPSYATWPLELPLGLLAAILLWLAWRRWYRRRESIRLLAAQAADSAGRPLETARDRGFLGFRTLLSVGVIFAIAGASAVGATILVPPAGPREVLRSAIVKPFDPRDYPSPLSGFRRYEKTPQANSTMLTVTGLPKGGRIRIATLDSYDGVVYSVGSDRVNSVSGSFTRVPYLFDQSAVRGEQLTLAVTVGDYSGVWLPTVGRFESIVFNGTGESELRDSFYYNDNSGTAAVVHGLSKGDRYTLTAVLPAQPSASQLASLQPGQAELPRIGVLPSELSTVLDGYVNGVTGPGARLSAMIAGLKQNGYLSHGVSANEPLSRSGHAADRITQLLTDQRMIGDQEQYAVTAALMARELGFPARVVFGFAPDGITRGAPTAIRGDEISAWIEVDTSTFGWVTVDPTPPVRTIPQEQPKNPAQIARPQSPVQPPAVQPQTRDTQVPPDSTQNNPPVLNPILLILLGVLSVTGWVALGAAIVLAPFIVIGAAKLRRRILRRRSPVPIQRITGGWQEFEDSVIDHGYTPPPSPTRSEVAATVGGMQTLVLASVTDRAVFSPHDPDAEEADQVWRSVQELRASLGTGLTRWQRIKAMVSVRSLGGYSVKNLFTRSRAPR
ncbi:MAG: transglutaminase-like domain-containing protein [Lacisediminihabitans sp.]